MAITYSINLTDSETPPTWLALCVTATPGAQDSGRVRYTVTTAQPAALEAALDADGDVIEYTRPEISLVFGSGAPSEFYPADEIEINGATDYTVDVSLDGEEVLCGSITLYRDKVNGGMSPCGSPLDGWVCAPLLKWLDKWPEAVRRAVIGALMHRDGGTVQV